MNVHKLMFIGELAAAAGVSCDTLRHYERKGVVNRPVRGANGYRLYPVKTFERVQMVRRALAVGFTLDELAQLFRERDKGNAPCQAARQLAGAKLADLEERLREMLALRDNLRAMIRDWDERLAENKDEHPVYLLENIQSVRTSVKRKKTLPSTTKNKKRGKSNHES